MISQYTIIRSITLATVIILVLVYTANQNKKEEWANYRKCPFNEIESGIDPLQYYRRDAYRLPYRYPFKFSTDYPYPHMRYMNTST
jgi:hypothetical protein